MKYILTEAAALPIVDIDPHRDYNGFSLCPSRRPTAGMSPVRVAGAEPEL
jgi:hypothetical protein